MERSSIRRRAPDMEEGCRIVEQIKKCCAKRDLRGGARIHAQLSAAAAAAKDRFIIDANPYIASALIHLYAECGDLARAKSLHEELRFRSLASWNALVGGYGNARRRGGGGGGGGRRRGICEDEEEDASSLSSWWSSLQSMSTMMQREALAPDHITFVGVLKGIGSIEEGDRVHAEILRRRLLDGDGSRSSAVVVLGTAIVDMYARCGELCRAEHVLEELPVRDVVSWSALIAGFARKQGLAHRALLCFEQMRAEGLTPDSVVFASVLKACAGAGDLDTGARVHDEILGLNLLGGPKNVVVVGAALVDMYVKLGALLRARDVHEKLGENRSSVSWNALIAGYVGRGRDGEALACFGQMREEGFCADPVTFVGILKACASTGDVGRGEAIHEEVVRRGLLEERNVILGTALVDMYAKCGKLAKARQVLEELPIRDRVSWSALITGYTQQVDRGHEALACFEQMQKEGFLADAVTFVCVLKACGSLGAVDKGKRLHDEVRSLGLVETNLILATALVGMYARCGVLAAALRTLEELPIRDVACWNALMAGYAQRGELEAATTCLRRLQDEDDLSPNAITFQTLLSACSHGGRLDEAQTYFESMTKSYGIVSDSEHQMCMVVASGGSGRFDKALALIGAMPSSDQPAAWMALLAACKKWGNLGLARLAYDNALRSDHACIAASSVLRV